MKHKGSIIDFTPKRNAEIIRTYRTIIAHADRIDRNKVFAQVANSPCSRFWVSEERAYQVVLAMLKGHPIVYTMTPNKREMFTEIHRRVCLYRTEHPDMLLADAVWDVVNSRAPKFYMTPKTIEEIINRIKRGYYDKK